VLDAVANHTKDAETNGKVRAEVKASRCVRPSYCVAALFLFSDL